MSFQPLFSAQTQESQRCSSGAVGLTPTSLLEPRMESTESQLLTVHVSQTAVRVWRPETRTVPITSPRTRARLLDQQTLTDRTYFKTLPEAAVAYALKRL